MIHALRREFLLFTKLDGLFKKAVPLKIVHCLLPTFAKMNTTPVNAFARFVLQVHEIGTIGLDSSPLKPSGRVWPQSLKWMPAFEKPVLT